MIKNNYHTHVSYCNHAVGCVEDYVKKAIELGFEEIGMTDHAPILESFMTAEEYKKNWCEQNMKMDIVPQYLRDIDEARKKYGHRIKILSGFESEFLPARASFYQSLKNQVDYLNLGVHYFEFKGKVYNSYEEVSYQTLEGYTMAAVAGMKSGLFNTLVHPDLFMFHYKDINGSRRFDEYCIEAARKICEAAEKYEVYLEVNAGGLKNSITYGNSQDWLYPYRAFWEIVREYPNIRILIGADAHHPDDLANANVEAVCRFCDELGLSVCSKMEVRHG